jgi:hypothetical protein
VVALGGKNYCPEINEVNQIKLSIIGNSLSPNEFINRQFKSNSGVS